MPTPSKATEARRRLIVALLGCGASRRQAAVVAGIHHSQIGRWVERGRRTHGGRFADFAAAVESAESHPMLTALPDLPDPVPAEELRWALRIAEREWRESALEDRQDPVVIDLRLDAQEPNPWRDDCS